MENRIGCFAAGILLCLFLGGCDADRALVLEIGRGGGETLEEVSGGQSMAGRPEEASGGQSMAGRPEDASGGQSMAGRPGDMSGGQGEAGQASGGGSADSSVIYVYVCGAVKSPQVVLLPAGSRGYQAVEAAGGLAEDAAADAVNLAESLEDGERFFIPTREEAEEAVWPKPAGQKPEAESGLVNINRADAAQLCTLPGIGEARADAIIAYRESNGGFAAPEDIMKVPGIKEGAFEKIKDRITVK